MSSPFTKKQLAKYRDRLEILIGELEKLDSITRESRKPVELDQTTQGRLSRMDALQVQAMQEATAERRRSEKMRAQAALDRMDAGDFGYCVSCGEEIPAKRLDHDPTVPTCVDCA
ncbi:MAG: TraR/DksA family transcriptional regulator [Rhodospirillales bacterium]